MRIAIALAFVFAAGCSSSPADAPESAAFPWGPQATDAASIAEGRAQALADIAKGDPHLFYFGLSSHDFSPLDPETGLLYESRGCVVTTEGASFVKGYNDATLEAAAAGRVDAYKDRVTTRHALEARFSQADVVTLTPEHPSMDVPGGKLRIELGPYQYSFDPPGKTTPYLFVVDVSTGERKNLHYLRRLNARIALDAEARTLFLDEGAGCFSTHDLATRRMLQSFVAPGTSQAELFESEIKRQ
jgi:hypothetical protein